MPDDRPRPFGEFFGAIIHEQFAFPAKRRIFDHPAAELLRDGSGMGDADSPNLIVCFESFDMDANR
jgi:hypothetical protein